MFTLRKLIYTFEFEYVFQLYPQIKQQPIIILSYLELNHSLKLFRNHESTDNSYRVIFSSFAPSTFITSICFDFLFLKYKRIRFSDTDNLWLFIAIKPLLCNWNDLVHTKHYMTIKTGKFIEKRVCEI